MREATVKYAGRPYSSLPRGVEGLLEPFLASVLLLLAMPAFLLLALGLLITDGRPILFKGKRLGRHKRPFEMYKFRTLRRGAHGILGARVYSDRHPRIVALLTPFGRFLRDTRLDELPQLFNILKGEMSFIGPRPERPEVYESISRTIPGSEKRFTVKPGLIGYAQLFTPHGSPKKLRVRFTNRFLDQKLGEWSRVKLGTHAAWAVIVLVLRTVSRQREDHRERLRGAKFLVTGPAAPQDGPLQLQEMNREVFFMKAARRLSVGPEKPLSFKLQIEWKRRNGSLRRKVAFCSGTVLETGEEEKTFTYLVQYKPESEMNQYICEQYFLHESISPPLG